MYAFLKIKRGYSSDTNSSTHSGMNETQGARGVQTDATRGDRDGKEGKTWGNAKRDDSTEGRRGWTRF